MVDFVIIVIAQEIVFNRKTETVCFLFLSY